ncbi:hypothetical protein JHK85_050837 [Glycine max]|nr:hypothetical protein JHK85_050837 [Glycine max]
MMASRTTILEEAFNLEVPNRLPPTKPPMSGLDATKYCRYHRGIGHNTEYYWALKDKIEELLQAGYEIRGVINTITDGFSYGGHSNQSQKCHLHVIWDIDINFVDTPSQRSLPPITLTDRDFKGINPVNQDDLVVVFIIIENFMVSKVLIDQGSSTDILYYKTFQRLKVSPDTIHPHTGPLLSFAGKRVETRGYVDLMTTFDQGKLSRSFTIRYLLIDVDTSYFALINRKTLNEL